MPRSPAMLWTPRLNPFRPSFSGVGLQSLLHSGDSGTILFVWLSGRQVPVPFRTGNEVNSEWLSDGISRVSYRIQNTENIYPLFAFCLFGFFVLSRRPLSGHFKKSVTAGQWGNWVFLISSVSTCLCYLFDSQSKTSPARKIPPQTLRRAQSQKSVQVALLFCLVKSLVLVVWFFLSRFICFWTD